LDGAIDNLISRDPNLKAELGDKYEELGEQVNNLKKNLKRLAEMAKKARPMPIKMQHVY